MCYGDTCFKYDTKLVMKIDNEAMKGTKHPYIGLQDGNFTHQLFDEDIITENKAAINVDPLGQTLLIFGSDDPSKYSVNSKNRTEAKCDLLKEKFVGVKIDSFEVSGNLGGEGLKGIIDLSQPNIVIPK